MDIQLARSVAAKKAVELIESGMIVGLGTGRTSELFIEELAKRNLSIQGVPSSRATAELAKKLKIPLLEINNALRIDITVDGADEIDSKKRMIKGGGGALFREKILASSSKKMVVIVDEEKKVSALGHRKLPVEILYYGAPHTRSKIEQLGYTGNWRVDPNGTQFITENGNWIFDIQFQIPLTHPEKVDDALKRIPGVVETGFFFNIAQHAIIGYVDGHIEIL